MSIAMDIKKLGEDIVTSYDARVKAVGVLVEDTHKLMKGIQRENKELFGGVHKMLEGFQVEHKEMAINLRASLEKGETERLKEFKSWWSSIQNGVQNLLENFRKAHAAMADELKKALAKGEEDRLKEFKPWWSNVEKEVADLLQAFKAEREKMAANWQSIVATMAKKRGIMPKVEAEVKVRPVKEAIEEDVSSEIDLEKLEKKVLKFIEKHPGVKVGDMEEPLGVARMKLGVIAKKLLDEGKVRKEENLYFPL